MRCKLEIFIIMSYFQMVLRFEVGKGGEIWIDNLGKKKFKICSNTKFY